jgi:hypothetical protein
MAAPFGNTNNRAFKDPELLKEAYASYLNHLAEGKGKRGWVFEHPDCTCTYQTIEKYMREDVNFDPIQIEIAMCKGYKVWEEITADSAKGVNKDANTASLQMIMRNKFGWDKKEEKSIEYDTTTLQNFEGLMLMFQAAQSRRIADKSNNAL